MRSRQQELEYGEKASKLLSHHLRQTTEAKYIAEIQMAHGVTTDQLSINKQFKTCMRSCLHQSRETG